MHGCQGAREDSILLSFPEDLSSFYFSYVLKSGFHQLTSCLQCLGHSRGVVVVLEAYQLDVPQGALQVPVPQHCARALKDLMTVYNSLHACIPSFSSQLLRNSSALTLVPFRNNACMPLRFHSVAEYCSCRQHYPLFSLL